MAIIDNETRTCAGSCPTHGAVSAEKKVPRLKFPFVITGLARGLARARPYRCPQCGAKTSAAA
jgi:hypothetical protein